ncbi:MAG: hypothetical protein JWR85_353 [Marmoricola sp.]|nr:hypothetical protein [Marmoricola sp.]
MSQSTLTDRYVWTVTRHLPPDTGPDVARELRGTIHDMTEARIETGADPVRAEETVLTELGDPDVLARKYGGRPAYLVGPGLFPDYVRLMKVLPLIVLPIVLVATVVDGLATSSDHWGKVVLDSVLALLSVAVHLAFWTTLVFVVIDWTRPESERDKPLTSWGTDRLPSEVPWRQVGLGETLTAVAFIVVTAGIVVWQFVGVGDGAGVQVLNPDLTVGWELLIVGLLLLEVVLAYAVWRAGRWTPTFAAVKVLINVGETAALLWLARGEELLAPGLPRELADTLDWSVDLSVLTAVLCAGIVLANAWDSVEAVLKARRAQRARVPA